MAENWIDAAAVADVPEGDVIGIRVAGKEIALYEVEGGFLEGREIECPLHQGRFDVCSGKALCAPVTADLTTYAVKIENLRVMLQLE